MNQNNIRLEEIRKLVTENETKVALEQLLNLLKGMNSNHYNEAVLHSARLTGVNKNERRGLLSQSNASTERSHVQFSILGLLDELERDFKYEPSSNKPDKIKFDAPDDTSLEKIFGSNQLKSIAWLQRGLEVSSGICRIITPSGMGSGFLLKNGYILTNHHVIPDADYMNNCKAEFNYEEDVNNRLKTSYRYPFIQDTFKTSKALDYSLMKIASTNESPELGRWCELPVAINTEPSNGDHVTIIQHPQGGPKQIAITANQVVNVYEHRLQYTTDTLPGSSGSPVFDDHWQVIALHHAGGNMISNKKGDRMFANEGILIQHIIRDSGLSL